MLYGHLTHNELFLLVVKLILLVVEITCNTVPDWLIFTTSENNGFMSLAVSVVFPLPVKLILLPVKIINCE